jgi:hypothetical protein
MAAAANLLEFFLQQEGMRRLRKKFVRTVCHGLGRLQFELTVHPGFGKSGWALLLS